MPISVTLSPRMPGTEPGSDEERVLTVTFEDGSLLTVLGTTRGDDIRGVQEQWTSGAVTPRSRSTTCGSTASGADGIERFSRTLFRDKAHTAMYREGLGRVKAGQPVGLSGAGHGRRLSHPDRSERTRQDRRRAIDLPGWITLARQDGMVLA